MLRCRYPGGALGGDELAVTRMLRVSAAWSRPAHHHLVHRQAADTGSILVTASSSPPRPPPGYRQRSILITSYLSSRLTYHQLSNPVSEEVNLFASSIEKWATPAGGSMLDLEHMSGTVSRSHLFLRSSSHISYPT